MGSSPNGVTMEIKNVKQIGEIGERIAIGELSKFGLDILLPMSDNLPFDLAIFYQNRIYKCQVKTTFTRTVNDSLEFDLTTNNWNKGTIYKYSKEDYDILICCDGNNIYLFPIDMVEGRKSITIRDHPPKNGQTKGINFAKDYIISQERLDLLLK